jgi:hypothetical protein
MQKVMISSGFSEALAKAHAKPGSYSKDVVAAWQLASECEEIAETLLAATHARCGCGDTGDWSHSVSGTSGMDKCVWAGCANCGGSAIGSPVLLSDLKKWKKLPEARKLQYLATAIAKHTGTKERFVNIDVDTIGSTIDYEVGE